MLLEKWNKVTLPRSGFGATAFGIFLDGDDIYLGGYTTEVYLPMILDANGPMETYINYSSVADTDQTWLYDIAVADGGK